MPPILFNSLLLPYLAPAETVARHFRSRDLLCRPDKRGKEVYSKMLVEAKNILGAGKARNINNKIAFFLQKRAIR